MNKKLKIAIALVLIIQLLVPFSLLIYNQSAMKTTLEKGTELKFRVLNIHTSSENDFSETEIPYIDFYIDGFVYNNKNVSIVSDSDGFAVFYREGRENDWVNRDFVFKAQHLKPDEISIAEPFTAENLRVYMRLNNTYKNTSEHFYITAKIYKGFFIPTAIYYDDMKIADIRKF